MTDWKGGVHNEGGLDVEAADCLQPQHKTVAGFSGAKPLTNEELFRLDVDVLIPAALERQITMENVKDIKAKLIIEGANGPTTPEADEILHDHGVFIVPDILANAGGVTVSYFEWVQDRYGYFWTEKEVNERLEAKMCEAFNAVLAPRRSTTWTCGVRPTSSRSNALRRSRKCVGCMPNPMPSTRNAINSDLTAWPSAAADNSSKYSPGGRLDNGRSTTYGSPAAAAAATGTSAIF